MLQIAPPVILDGQELKTPRCLHARNVLTFTVANAQQLGPATDARTLTIWRKVATALNVWIIAGHVMTIRLARPVLVDISAMRLLMEHNNASCVQQDVPHARALSIA